MLTNQDIRFAVAPMMDWTDRHCRYFHRLLSRRARLYTEMLTTGAVIHGDRARLMAFDPFEQPVAMQLGGAEPAALATSAVLVEKFGYAEVNLNVGCPSDRVQNGAFGACLMREPDRVGDCIKAMKDAVAIPVTVKCRIGVDDQDPEKALFALAEACVDSGADALFVHARKAWLKGLSPKENRDVPPLDYRLVHRLKRALPDVPVAINGGLTRMAEMQEQLQFVDGVMIGRAAYHDPALLLDVDPLLFGQPSPAADLFDAVDAFLPYVERELAKGERLSAMTRHLLGLFAGMPGARSFRRRLALEAVKPGAGVETLLDAVGEVRAALARFADAANSADAEPAETA
ncbi:tRNA dihydrouridine(20/20a) synthase DusA [Methylocystis sp. L43]|jgi:tRNA-dihydrouridine synthase A|uniref:tRNA dihydrouridine(20/20a) synthase DusA n=1 Tax=unclassified Methylocystis TaxID=2625913 RepID=UPI0018C1E60A|nr:MULTISPECIES: tRNA dihydrouridine(20/20a) synthase DusA [unclassified Methylocystis]MBG0797531.1 tRNA dihydrouridine(20/20a) synthase DusA [Methylocystis sp. L43]MBG0805136.1 tRNA dihydrouridine(20/20a) synthase DusA [Methylocystis sp. H15]